MSGISVTQKVITAEAANAAVVAAVAKARELGLLINVAVTDTNGTLMAFLRMPTAFLHSIDIAIDKAKTASGFRMATGDLYNALKENDNVTRGLIRRDNCVLFGGGMPLMDGDDIIGGIGVSGASEDEDLACAAAGAKALENLG